MINATPTPSRLGSGFDAFDDIRCLTSAGRSHLVARSYERFAELGVAHRVRLFDGSFVDELEHPEPTAAYRWRSRYLTSLSHREVWRAALSAGSQRLLVMEDDIGFVEWDQSAFDAAVADLPDDWQVLYIGYILRQPAKLPPARLRGRHLLEFDGDADVRSGVCYALNLQHAEQLSSYDPATDGVVDRWLSEHLRTLCVHPLMAVEDQTLRGRYKPDWFLQNASKVEIRS